MSAAEGSGVVVSAGELIRLRLNARTLQLTRRRPSAAPLAGLRQSRLRGRGVDYLESRIYQPGDDIRHMDWRVTARSGKPHSKVFEEERERQVIVVIDANPSMFFGTRTAFKSVVAARLAALIGWSTVANGDRIGAFFFAPQRHRELQPAGGRRGAMRLIHQLVDWGRPAARFDAPAAGPLSDALRRLRRVARPGSLVVLLSDFYALDADAENHLKRLRAHADLVACQIVDPLEIGPPPPGRYLVSDGEQQRLLDSASALGRERYQAYFAAHHARLETVASRCGMPLIRVVTNDDLAAKLRRGLYG